MANASIDIHNTDGSVIANVIITKDAERVEELMSADHAQLSWQSDSGTSLPAGAYITFEGERLSLLDPYEPEQKNEAEWSYRPQFQSRVMGWQKVPFFHYVYGAGNAITGREPDWTLTDTPANFMRAICTAIKNETGEVWTFEVAADLAASATISFAATDVFSGINSIAAEFGTEWRADKTTNTLYLGKAQFGNSAPLTVGENISVPSVTLSKERYYNRFFIYGSTRNITQDYQGANTNSLVNKRLTLDPVKYPGGYIDIPRATGVPVYPKILRFDDVYPHSGLSIANLRPRLMYRLDESQNKIQVGTDSEGNPVYDMYTIWYFQLPDFTLNDSTYSKDNPNGMLISGKSLSVHFKSGALQGREFELIYHSKAQTLRNSDGQDFNVLAGDYEIKFIEESGLIIPMQTGIVPADGDEVTLFNLRMPSEYIATAYAELEAAALKEIDERYTVDLNNYTVKSNPVAFNASDPQLKAGRSILFVNGGYSYTTRVIRVVRKMDYTCEQEITIGNDKIKGNTASLKEEVVNANSNINLLVELNQLTQNVTQAYQRTQQMILDSLNRAGNMWRFHPTIPDAIVTDYNVLGLKEIVAKATGGDSSLIPGQGGASGKLENLLDVSLSALKNGDGLVYRNGAWRNEAIGGGLDETALATYLSSHNYITSSALSGYALLADIPSLAGYATEQWVLDKNYLTAHQSLANYYTKNEADNAFQPKGNYLTAHQSLANYYTKNEADNAFQPKGSYLTAHQDISHLLPKATFNEAFEIVTNPNGSKYLRIKLNTLGDGEITAKANGGSGSAPGFSASGRLENLLDVSLSALASGHALVYNAAQGKWVNQAISQGLDESALASYLTANNYVKKSDIPSLTGYATQSWVSGNFVTRDTAQEITAAKTFTNQVRCSYALMFKGSSVTAGIYIAPTNDGKISFCTHKDWSYTETIGHIFPDGHIEMPSFVKRGGTAAQFLKADGSVDSNSYALASALNNYLYAFGQSDFDPATYDGYYAGMTQKSGITTDWWHILSMNWGTTNTVGNKTWASQLALPTQTRRGLRYRTAVGALAYSDWVTVLDESNYSSVLDSRYVNAAGDTMTGTLTIGANDTGLLWLNQTNANGNGAFMASQLNGVSKAAFGWTADARFGSYLYSYASDKYMGITDAGTPHFNGNTLWHSGNDGSGSGLDADLLDGYHASSFYRSRGTNLNLNAQGDNNENNGLVYINKDAAGWSADIYPIKYGSALNLNTSVASTQILFPMGGSEPYYRSRWWSGNNNPWGSWKRLAFTNSNVASASKLANTRTLWGQNFNGEGNVSGNMTGVGSITASGQIKVKYAALPDNNKWATDDGQITVRSSADHGLGIGASEDGYGIIQTSQIHVGTIPLLINPKGGNVGFGTLSPAYKVDINGALRASGDIISNSANALRAANSKYGLILRHDEANSYFLLTNENDPYGTWNNLRPFYINNASGWVTMGNGASISKLNVGSPTSEKYALNTSTFICDSWVRTRGGTGWYSETYGGGIYMSDTTWVRTYNDKGLYVRNTIQTNTEFVRVGYAGHSWNNGIGALAVEILNNNLQTPLIVAYRSGAATGATGANRLFALEFLNAGTQLAFGFGGAHKFTMYSNGNFLANGEITAKNVSDFRLKENIRTMKNAVETLRGLGGYYLFDYKEGVVDFHRFNRIGLIWQNVTGHFGELMGLKRDDGYGALNYIKPDYINLIGAGVLEIDDRVRTLESEVKALKEENAELKRRLNLLNAARYGNN